MKSQGRPRNSWGENHGRRGGQGRLHLQTDRGLSLKQTGGRFPWTFAPQGVKGNYRHDSAHCAEELNCVVLVVYGSVTGNDNAKER